LETTEEKKYIEKLVEDNFRLSYYIAKKMNTLPIPYEERVSICQFYLYKSATNFKEEKGFKFATYAVKAMKNGLLQTLRKQRVETISYD